MPKVSQDMEDGVVRTLYVGGAKDQEQAVKAATSVDFLKGRWIYRDANDNETPHFVTRPEHELIGVKVENVERISDTELAEYYASLVECSIETS